VIVPNYWAEASTSVHLKGRRMTLRRFGWSDDGPAEAQAQAELRVAEAARLAADGQDVPRHEPKLAYNGADGVPIREEVLARHGDAVITRNAYGARCLNVPDLLIADIDFETRPSGLLFKLSYLAVFLLTAGLVIRFGFWTAVFSGVVAAVLAGGVLATALQRLKPLWMGSAPDRANRKIRGFVADHTDWLLRVYSTPAGLRLIATHARFTPASDAVQALFQAVGVDPVYARMCLNQRCFRARLSAKPWRIGIPEHLKPRPGVWPVQAERLPARAAWVDRYEATAAAYAACRYEGTVGTGTEDAVLAALVALHDAQSQALDLTRPLA
jgi:hypothetical protein